MCALGARVEDLIFILAVIAIVIMFLALETYRNLLTVRLFGERKFVLLTLLISIIYCCSLFAGIFIERYRSFHLVFIVFLLVLAILSMLSEHWLKLRRNRLRAAAGLASVRTLLTPIVIDRKTKIFLWVFVPVAALALALSICLAIWIENPRPIFAWLFMVVLSAELYGIHSEKRKLARERETQEPCESLP